MKHHPAKATILTGIASGIVIAVAACSSDDRREALDRAVSDHSQVLCDRLFSCCSASELADLAFVDEKSPPTHEGCLAYHKRIGSEYVGVTEAEEGAGRVAIHVEGSSDCLQETRDLSCSEFHARLVRIHVGDAFLLCNSAIVEGVVDDGNPCRMYLDCKSGHCQLPPGANGDAGPEAVGTCKPLPKKGEACPDGACSADLRCDPMTTMCSPLVATAGACVADDECKSGACRDNHCVSPGKCGR